MIILWIISIASLLFGLLFAISNASLPVIWYYNKWAHKKEIDLPSMLPLAGGVALFFGVFTLPIELPYNRFALSILAMFLDIMTPMTLFVFPYVLLFSKDPDYHWLNNFKHSTSPRNMSRDNGLLQPRENWPDDFKEFLTEHNGCDAKVSVDIYDKKEIQNTQWLETRIPIPDRFSFFKRNSSFVNSLVTVYGQSECSEHTGRGWLAETDSLIPENTVVIGKFIEESLLVISLRAHDSGHIYYLDRFRDHPCRGSFYKRKLKSARKNSSGGQFEPRDEYLVLLADSFSKFVAKIQPIGQLASRPNPPKHQMVYRARELSGTSTTTPLSSTK